MKRRRTAPRSFLAAVSAGALLLAACGDDNAPGTSPPTDGPNDTLPPVSDPGPDGDGAYEHPTGADAVVIEVTYEGGFMPLEGLFARLPTVLVDGSGRRFEQGPQVAIYPGPLLPNVQVSQISEDGIQALLELAAEHGLLSQREYDAPTNIADAPDTVVTINVDGATYVHRAYALGLGGGPDGSTEERGDRAELQAFVDALTSDGDRPDSVAFEAETYLVRAFPVDDLSGFDIEPTVVDWPADVSVALSSALDCAAIPADEVAGLFADADQLTFFAEGGVTYSVAVRPQLPGDTC